MINHFSSYSVCKHQIFSLQFQTKTSFLRNVLFALSMELCAISEYSNQITLKTRTLAQFNFAPGTVKDMGGGMRFRCKPMAEHNFYLITSLKTALKIELAVKMNHMKKTQNWTVLGYKDQAHNCKVHVSV